MVNKYILLVKSSRNKRWFIWGIGSKPFLMKRSIFMKKTNKSTKTKIIKE